MVERVCEHLCIQLYFMKFDNWLTLYFICRFSLHLSNKHFLARIRRSLVQMKSRPFQRSQNGTSWPFNWGRPAPKSNCPSKVKLSSRCRKRKNTSPSTKWQRCPSTMKFFISPSKTRSMPRPSWSAWSTMASMTAKGITELSVAIRLATGSSWWS